MSHRVEQLPVVLNDGCGGGDAVVYVVLLGPRLEDGAKFVIVVAGNRGEQVVLQLRVHAAPQPGLHGAEHLLRRIKMIISDKALQIDRHQIRYSVHPFGRCYAATRFG